MEKENVINIFLDGVSSEILNLGYIESVALSALHICSVAGVEASIVLADDDTLRGLNRDYRGIDETTDVLSFSNDTKGNITVTRLILMIDLLETALCYRRLSRINWVKL